ncbi:MAG: DedA family protein [Candidatus Woesearchaeota archaeon]|jgi:membrane-associated protein
MYLIDFVLHLDTHLQLIIQNYGLWTYLIIFLIIFCETGLVVTPFLPGDSLIFVLGAFAATGSLNIWLLFALLFIAATLGNISNYHIGSFIGERVYRMKVWFIKKQYLNETKAFYKKHGGKTVVLARFMPVIRTFAPFVAGVGKMNKKMFIFYSIIGCIAWISLFLFAGFFFGNIPWVSKNLTIVIFGIVILSFVPPLYEIIKRKIAARKNKKTEKKKQSKKFKKK